jgi:hypothetical protein
MRLGEVVRFHVMPVLIAHSHPLTT